MIVSLEGSDLNIGSICALAKDYTCLTISFLRPSFRNLLRTGSALVETAFV